MNTFQIIAYVLRCLITGFLFGIVLGLVAVFLVRGTARADVNIAAKTILTEARKHKIDPLLIAAVIKVESNWNHKAVGSSGEVGLMQLNPRFFSDASFDVKENIEAGVTHMAYVRKHCSTKDNYTWVVCYNNGIGRTPRYPELHPYFKKVTRAYEELKKAR